MTERNNHPPAFNIALYGILYLYS